MGIAVPEFKKVLEICVSNEVIDQFTPVQATADTPLVVYNQQLLLQKVYRPMQWRMEGYVFDMRGILNPGRIGTI